MRARCFLLTLFVGIVYSSIVMAYTLEDIKNITNGDGIFVVTINNNEKYKFTDVVNVDLINPPIGYENHSFGCFEFVSIEPYSSVNVLLRKPLVGDYSDYRGIGPELSANSRVVVSFGDSGGFLRQTGQAVRYQARYLTDTKIIDVPKITFDIGVNQQQLRQKNPSDSFHNSDHTSTTLFSIPIIHE